MATLGAMTANVSRKLGDQTVGQYFTAAEIKQAIGEGYRYYVMRMIALASGYFETTANLNLVANTETVSLSSLSPAFFRLSQLFRYITGGETPLEPWEARYSTNVTTGSGTGDAYLPRYKFRGLNLVLVPKPLFSETAALKIDYVYIPTFPTYDSLDAFVFDTNFPTMFEANVEIRAVIKCLESKQAVGGVVDYSTFTAELQQLDETFNATIAQDEAPDSVEYVGIDYSGI